MIKVVQTGFFGVNTLIVALGENKVFVVDSANSFLSNDETSLADYLKSKKLECAAVVLTHGHFDHVPGIKILKKEFPSAPILISKEDSKYLGSGGNSVQKACLEKMGLPDFFPAVKDLPEAGGFLVHEKSLYDSVCAAAAGFSCSDEVADSLKKWIVIATPGHTKGSVCLYNPVESFLISGDTMFFNGRGRTDLGGSEPQIQKSLEFLKNVIPPETVVFPGHDRAGFLMKENTVVF